MVNSLVCNNKIKLNPQIIKQDCLSNLNPWWVTGFSDAESSFSMFISRSKNTIIGWTITPTFNITLHIRDIELLKSIQNFFNGVGKINIQNNKVNYRVRSKEELKIIINHFNKYPLLTSKFINFTLFVKIYKLIESKAHLNKKGFLEIASLVNKLNKPLSTTILQDLFNLGKLKLSNISLELPVLNKNPNLNPWWISGFICGEGSFTYFTRTRKNSKGKISKDYTLVKEVSQDNKDSFILTCIQEYFNVGKIYYEIRGIAKFRLVIKKDIIEKWYLIFLNILY